MTPSAPVISSESEKSGGWAALNPLAASGRFVWTLGLSEVPSERLVHHGLVARSGALGTRTESIQDGVVEEDRDPRLPLLRDQRFAFSLGEIVFSSHSIAYGSFKLERWEMKAQRLHVVVPENRRATIEFPEAIRPGLVELTALVPEDEEPEAKIASPQGRGRLAQLAAEVAQENRPFRDLTLEERGARLRRLRGAGRG
jgi:hypothetical protein